jgi:hypothetical protein
MKRRNRRRDSTERRWLALIGGGAVLAVCAFVAVFHGCFEAPPNASALSLVESLISYFTYI